MNYFTSHMRTFFTYVQRAITLYMVAILVAQLPVYAATPTPTPEVPVMRNRIEVDMNAKLDARNDPKLGNIHEVMLTPKRTLTTTDAEVSRYLVECVVWDDWKSIKDEFGLAKYPNGTICSSGTREWDIKRCKDQYTVISPERESRCTKVTSEAWEQLDKIGWKLETGKYIPGTTTVHPGTALFQNKTPFSNDGSVIIGQSDTFSWHSTTKNDSIVPGHWWYMVGYTDKRDTTLGTNDGKQSLQVSDQIFTQGSAIAATPQVVRFDPFGYVFDAASLEPLAGVNTFLFEKPLRGVTPDHCTLKNASVFSVDLSSCNALIGSTYVTDRSGLFAYPTTNGQYALDIFGSKPSPEVLRNYTVRDPSSVLMAVADKVDSIKFAKKVGANEYSVIVPVGSEQKTLYKNLYPLSMTEIEPIIELNRIERRDMPVSAIALGISVDQPVTQVIPYSRRDNLSGGLYAFGIVSHPYTLIQARVGGKTVDARADENGKWSLTIPEDMLVVGQVIPVDFTKPDFYGDPAAQARRSKRPRFVAASTSTITMEPVPRYIDAIARYEDGQIIPAAKVNVYDEVARDVTYSTTADKDGRYVIPPQYIPRISYRIEYETTKGIVRAVPPAEVISENSGYYVSKRIDLFSRDVAQKVQESYIASGSASVPTVTNQPTRITPPLSGGGAASSIPSVQPTQNPTSLETSRLMSYLALLVFLIISVAIMVIFYIRKHREPHLYE
jgi:hypothetical protein